MSAPVLDGLAVLSEEAWTSLRTAHEERVDTLLAGHLERAGRGERHPVDDFLFTYYSLRPAQLRRWHPGAGVVLLGERARERASWRDHTELTVGEPPEAMPAVTLDVAAFLTRRGQAVAHVRALLEATARRRARLGCFGMHEWAMVYRLDPDEVRHAAWPLRLGPQGTDRVVETSRVRCSHFDAYRFFTPAAAPLNTLRPSRDTTVALEQPGCLHGTMDLYKWSYKFAPAVPSDLVADAFELARDARELDMRASPYDLRTLGYEPVRVETAEGRAEYVAAQRRFAEQGAQLRGRLLAALTALP